MSTKIPVRLIPALTGIGVALPGCGLLGEPIVGEWEVTQYFGDVLPKSYTDDGTTYTFEARLTFENDNEVEFLKTKTATGAKTGTKAYVENGTWTKESKGEYVIDLGPNSILDCTLSNKEIECDDQDGDRAIEAIPYKD